MIKPHSAWVILLYLALSIDPIAATEQEKIYGGVAANYIPVFNELSQSFKKKTGVKIEATFTSSGNVYNQIINGAPYDLFLSAHEERPDRLHKEGLSYKPFIYARGRVILWSAKNDLCNSKDWRIALEGKNIKKIAIANPETAPYGLAAKKALRKAGLWDLLNPKIVYSQDITQAFQYASTGAVDAGFCALSALYSKQGQAGCHYTIEEAPLIIQSACVLKRTKNRTVIEKFVAFLNSTEGVKIKEKYGYR